jgi:uncharacterized phage protein (TIGR02220 family)
MSRLLINEASIMIIPSLAVKLGLNEAAVLQQILYWVESSQHLIERRKWIFNTYKDWQKQFPFWSESTIKRAIRSLEDQGLLITGNFNRMQMDKIKWYTIDYARLGALEEPNSKQDEPVSHEEGSLEATLLNTAIQESPTKKKIPVLEIIQYINVKTKVNYNLGTLNTQELIRARVREGFKPENLKKIIDLKTAEWVHDPRLRKYLRPATLFGSKLNHISTKSLSKNR